MSTVAQFSINYTQYLDSEGHPIGHSLPACAQDKELLQKMYRTMVLIRTFDTKAINLQRTGKISTYPSTLGQEAISVGYGLAMQPKDVLVPYYRDYGAQYLRGMRFLDILLYWGGDERGNHLSATHGDLPICVPIASQTLHAVGIAKAFQYRKQPQTVLVTCGDGATSEGDFYEAINLAGCWNLPIVFIVNNNQWAISIHRSQQTKCSTIAQKAIAGGFPGEQVDGNDILAVYDRTNLALEKARHHGGPTLIETLTYRLCDHTTADDASRYREKSELEEAWKNEPIKRLKQYLINQQWWNDELEASLLADCAQEVEQAVADYTNMPPQPVTSMFDYLYAQLTPDLEKQRLEVEKYGEKHG